MDTAIDRFRPMEAWTMKNLSLLATLFLLVCSVANSSPVSLNCVSNAADQDIEEVVIRFDEAAKTFELYGKAMW